MGTFSYKLVVDELAALAFLDDILINFLFDGISSIFSL